MNDTDGHVPPARLVRRVKTRKGFIEIKILGREKKIVLTKYEHKKGRKQKEG